MWMHFLEIRFTIQNNYHHLIKIQQTAVDWWQATAAAATGGDLNHASCITHDCKPPLHSQQMCQIYYQSMDCSLFLRRRETTVVCIVSLVMHDEAVVDKIETVGTCFIRTCNHLTHWNAHRCNNMIQIWTTTDNTTRSSATAERARIITSFKVIQGHWFWHQSKPV